MRPAVRAMVTQTSAELMRRSHPNRLRFEMFADENPFMRPVAEWAIPCARTVARCVRISVPACERMMSDLIASGLEMWGNARDAATEAFFFSSLRLAAAASDGRAARRRNVASRRIARDVAREAAAKQAAAHLEERIDQGGLIEAAVRALIYVRLPEGKVDERGFAALKQIGGELPAAKRVGFAQFKDIVKEQYLILLLDAERAISALPKLLPGNRRSATRRWHWYGGYSPRAARSQKRAAAGLSASRRCSPVRPEVGRDKAA